MNIINFFNTIYRQKDKLWALLWMGGMGVLWLWNLAFLNAPALARVQTGFANTLVIAALVILLTLVFGWGVALLLDYLEGTGLPFIYYVPAFLLNILRSIPQIVGILLGYVIITTMIQNEVLDSGFTTILLIALVISLFVFLEVVDLIRERIDYFKQLDFYNAMRVCGISENRIINREILWKNSLAHIFNKLISIFGMTFFLLCSADFIVSVGLSTDVAATSLPVTLGSLLANIDSKQDILAIGHSLTNWGYADRLFFEHLQGITVAFLIVFTLICIYKISNGFARRYRL